MNFRARALMAIAGWLALATGAHAAGVMAFPGPDVRMEVINLPSAPPGQMAESPGGGGVVTTPAVLFNPASGENIYGPAVVMIDEGPGSNPLRQGEPSRFAAAALAARGYTVLSLYTHLERGYSLFPFEATGPEIDAALYFLEQRGHEGFVLAGKGYGAVAAVNYLKTFKDEPIDAPGTRRVKGLVLFSPLTELRAYPDADLQASSYERLAAAAKASVASGAGRYPAGNVIEVGGTLTGKVDPWTAAGPFNGPPEQFQSYWSPDAQTRNLAAFAAVKVPTLVLGAGDDPAYSESRLRGLMHPTSLKVVSFPGAGRHFVSGQAQASTQMADWLTEQGLGVRPKVVESLADVTAADGQDLPAVVYAPAGGADPKKPAILFVHGRTGDTIQSSGHWVGWRLAQRGYVVFTPRLRVSGAAGFASTTLAQETDDLGRWAKEIDRLGYPRMVAVGHSNGGIYISTYLSKTHDPRIIGVAFMAPTVNERDHTIERDGRAKFDRDLAEAKAAVDRGEGLTHMVGYLTARVYWDVNRPDTLSTHTDRIREYSVPTLSIVGKKDPLFATGFMERFTAAQNPGLAKTVWLENGTHGMRENKDVVADQIAGWIDGGFRPAQ